MVTQRIIYVQTLTPHTPLSDHLFEIYADFLTQTSFWDTLYKMKNQNIRFRQL